jgi:hypothetical protein
MSASPELASEARFLHLLFEQTQSKIYVVILYFDNEHGVTSDATEVNALPAVSQGSR